MALKVPPGLTHLDATGAARMVDISEKWETHRVAVASAFVEMALETVEMIVAGTAPKGDVLATDGKTGIEMEALTAAAVAGLTLYDMCKAVDRGMVIGDLMLLHKEGGQTGVWIREEARA